MAHRIPECPRCAYDLSGMVESWREHCPLDATCAECGLVFECRDVFSEHRAPPRWMFEYGTLPSIFRLLKTVILLTLRTAWFWRRVRLANPIRTRRLIALTLITLLALHLVHCAAAAAWIYLEDTSLRSNWVRNAAGQWVQVFVPPPTAGAIFTERWPELARAILWPYGKVGRSRAELHAASLAVLVFACAVPLAFFALGDTMRMCRVRRLHLFRGWAWSLPPVTIMVALGLAIAVYIHRPQALLLPVAIACPWLAWYWHVFTLRYLRLTHAWGVSLAMITIGFLSTLALFLTLTFTINRL